MQGIVHDIVTPSSADPRRRIAGPLSGAGAVHQSPAAGHDLPRFGAADAGAGVGSDTERRLAQARAGCPGNLCLGEHVEKEGETMGGGGGAPSQSASPPALGSEDVTALPLPSLYWLLESFPAPKGNRHNATVKEAKVVNGDLPSASWNRQAKRSKLEGEDLQTYMSSQRPSQDQTESLNSSGCDYHQSVNQ
ncbi:hypothetical protein chiPu_0015833 [Chiloscyllium punctatum]|uniref:Uncharacterized protein n=1 Tax=Chiloscyllium punctatum TaxID=137246 RepID=A0A401T3U7_CHIPU|nr:hypothetical protein [Chiloscyllium punctatum]